jgi:hypothetical protein
MGIDALITQAIIELLERGIVLRTLKELARAVSNTLGVRVSERSVAKALRRNRHRITFEFGQFELTFHFR